MPANHDAVPAADRRRQAAVAGHDTEATAPEPALSDPDPEVRALALGAMRRRGQLTETQLLAGLEDEARAPRLRAAELAGRVDSPAVQAGLIRMLGDPDPLVAETAAASLGELTSSDEAVRALSAMAGEHSDPLCREAAVAGLGALGEPAGLAAILAAMSDKPAIRRRAVIALAPFEGAEVDGALERALTDRDWQVRQAAEDLLGRFPSAAASDEEEEENSADQEQQ
jgi:HEAT repeat protein